MGWPKGKKRAPGTVGRKPGVPNALSRTAKENIASVFDRIGGDEGMAEWASANKTEFYKIYARLLPHELAGSGPGGAFVLEAPWWKEVAESRGVGSTPTDPGSDS